MYSELLCFGGIAILGACDYFCNFIVPFANDHVMCTFISNCSPNFASLVKSSTWLLSNECLFLLVGTTIPITDKLILHLGNDIIWHMIYNKKWQSKMNIGNLWRLSNWYPQRNTMGHRTRTLPPRDATSHVHP